MRHTLQILFSFSGTMVTRCCISIIWLELVLVLIGCTTKNISAFQLSRISTVSFPNQPLVQRTPFQSHSYGFGQHGHRHLHETRIFSSDGVSEDDKESGMLPNDNKSSKEGIKYALGSFVTTVVMSLTFFFSIDQASISAYQNDILAANGLSNNIVAAATEEESKQNIPPPPITTTSSERSLKIGKDLKELNSRFFCAYWCSHCYEQKLRLGKEAMTNVQYIECSKEGLNSQAAVCNDRKVPGYPTWEIGGKLYPGEMYLDELEDIIAKAKKDI
mmetsp:Transcript_11124/g.12288  ORF Transcript_11124/g.12288 Transcript_11124/m.12288 type:complete len:274 (+) Transcript_11124:143-964(+)